MLLGTTREKPSARARRVGVDGVARAGDRARAERQRVGFVAPRPQAARSRGAAPPRATERSARRAPAARGADACTTASAPRPPARPDRRRRRRASTTRLLQQRECAGADTAAGRARPARCASGRCAAGGRRRRSRSTSWRSTKLCTSSSGPATQAGLRRPSSRIACSAATIARVSSADSTPAAPSASAQARLPVTSSSKSARSKPNEMPKSNAAGSGARIEAAGPERHA